MNEVNEVKAVGQKFIIPAMLGILIITTLVAMLTGKDSYDILRWFVLAEMGTMIILYSASIVSDAEDYIAYSGHGTRSGDAALSRVIFARLTRSMGIIVLIGTDMWQITERLGNDYLNPLTPLSQLALVFLVNSWMTMDRVSLAPPKVVIDDPHDLPR